MQLKFYNWGEHANCPLWASSIEYVGCVHVSPAVCVHTLFLKQLEESKYSHVTLGPDYLHLVQVVPQTEWNRNICMGFSVHLETISTEGAGHSDDTYVW